MADIGVSDFAAVSFPANGEEDAATRDALKELIG
jgi:hypothetical protein